MRTKICTFFALKCTRIRCYRPGHPFAGSPPAPIPAHWAQPLAKCDRRLRRSFIRAPAFQYFPLFLFYEMNNGPSTTLRFLTEYNDSLWLDLNSLCLSIYQEYAIFISRQTTGRFHVVAIAIRNRPIQRKREPRVFSLQNFSPFHSEGWRHHWRFFPLTSVSSFCYFSVLSSYIVRVTVKWNVWHECRTCRINQTSRPEIHQFWRQCTQRKIRQSCCFVELPVLSSATW